MYFTYFYMHDFDFSFQPFPLLNLSIVLFL